MSRSQLVWTRPATDDRLWRVARRAFHLLILLLIAAVAAGCGGAARSADEIASGLRRAVQETEGAPQLEPVAERRAARAVCAALNVAASQGVDVLVEELKREAALAKVRADLGLEEYDPRIPDRLVAAADEIDSTQKAAEVASLFCA